MKIKKFARLALALLVASYVANTVAQPKISDDVVKIGVLTDLSGVNADLSGPGSVYAAQLAAQDFGGKVLGIPIEIVSADHLNKADIAATKAREWFDKDKVDMIVDVVVQGLPVMQVAKDKNKIVLLTGTGNTRVTNEDCNNNTVQWVFDTDVLSRIVARELLKKGFDSWYFLTADYVFGVSLEKSATQVLLAGGGKVLGSVRHPYLASDFSSFILKAQQSGAKVIGLANASGDTINAIKAAEEFGVTPKQTLAALLLQITDVHSLGLKTAQGMYLADGFYWDRNDETRAWSKRFYAKMKRMPTMNQAGVYSAVTHYLKAIQAASTDDTQAVMKKMRDTPVNDFFAKNGQVRADGRMVHDMYFIEVKKPGESKYPWDYYHIRRTVPAAEAFPSLSESRCALVKK
ncbi:ABC transporter substrate-binding protein [Glaciimonas sp. PCH181]|uniref:ABC transporter substrate-binding protein n=1 Tax=Glaciimonas sp. PCH181 TaxID=2133943 RepID=UPI000D37A722|nr:ABC transporter substrate-binding protein [Glaciimonas sp. PCH181]PUA19497.1 ABC transporter permease [Glaciimonas sp. PCH181]